MNNFDTDLKYSAQEGLSSFVNEAYRKAFPHIVDIQTNKDLRLQRLGVDKILITENGKRILIDEKIRRKHYGDIALEEYSDYDKKKKGWMAREKHTDYIVYIIPASRLLYCFPFLLLQKVFRQYYHEWLKLYGRKFAINKGYKTSFISVPTARLMELIKDAMLLKF